MRFDQIQDINFLVRGLSNLLSETTPIARIGLTTVLNSVVKEINLATRHALVGRKIGPKYKTNKVTLVFNLCIVFFFPPHDSSSLRK